MQHNTKQLKARKATTGKTSKNSPPQNQKTARKALTPEQRQRKNRKDRERRARLRAASAKAGSVSKPAPAPCRSAVSGVSCTGHCPAGTCRRGGVSAPPVSCPPALPSAVSTTDALMRKLGELVLSRFFQKTFPARPCGAAFSPERGVLQQPFVSADGRTALLTLVDGEAVDPVSPFSPLPVSVRHDLLLARMVREISDLVDARAALLA